MTVKAQELLHDVGIGESRETIIMNVNGSIPAGLGNQPCAHIFAA